MVVLVIGDSVDDGKANELIAITAALARSDLGQGSTYFKYV
jgi:hypothetical protein